MPGKWGGTCRAQPPRSANELGCQANGGAHAGRAPPRSANGFAAFYFQQHVVNKECIPVGCVPPACCPYLPACTAPGAGCTCPGCVPAQGVYLLRGVYLQGVYLPRGCSCSGVYLLRGVPAWGVYLPG